MSFTGFLNAQTISEIKYVSNIGDYSVYIEGKSRTNCYISGANRKLIGYGKDFFLMEGNNIYTTFDCNCKRIASKETANIKVSSVFGNTIRTKQLNGTYDYNKYWKYKK